jgi:predicted nuclease of predicted toxin-antitoxin system
MTLLIDECVPDSVTHFLIARGHTVHLARELLGAGAADPLVAVGGNALEAIVVTWNHKDFKKLASRFAQKGGSRLRTLGRISFRCDYAKGLRRLEQEIELIEFEYTRRAKKKDQRLFIEISDSSVKFS